MKVGACEQSGLILDSDVRRGRSTTGCGRGRRGGRHVDVAAAPVAELKERVERVHQRHGQRKELQYQYTQTLLQLQTSFERFENQRALI